MQFAFKGFFKETVRVIFLSLILVLPFQNCSTYNEGSPFEFHSSVTAASSLPFEARLDSPMGVLDVGEQDSMISVGGDCNVGSATKHYIEIRFMNAANQPLPAREDTLCPVSGSSDPECLVSKIARCEHGKYYAVVPINCRAYPGAAQGLYRLLGQLVTIDSAGKEVRDTKASFDRQFQIAWIVGSCN
jgi:hypothetical protein